MTAFALVLLTLLALSARALYLELDLAGWECLWRVTSGPVAVELRRNAGMARLAGDARDGPLPREFRALSLRIGDVPVWSRQSIVSLPAELETRIAEVSASEFDRLFTGAYRLGWSRRTMDKLYSVRH